MCEVLPREVAMRDHDALRPTGGARGVHQAMDVVRFRRDACRLLRPGAELAEGRPSVQGGWRHAGTHECGFDPQRRLAGQLEERLVADDGTSTGVLQDVPHLWCSK